MHTHPINIEHALLDPSSEFCEPFDVLDCQELSIDIKFRILKQWAFDAKEMATACNENMSGSDPDMLRRVLKAIHALEEASQTKH